MSMRGGIVLTLALAASLWSGEARAQVEASEVRLAAAAYERGMESLNQQHYADAIVEFRESYRRNPLPDVLFNMALAFRGAGRIAAALGAFERYLAAAPTNAPPERVQAITQIVPQLEQQVGRIVLTLDPTDAAVRVDGRPVVMSTQLGDNNDFVSIDPRDHSVRVDPGSHTVEVTAPGRRMASREVSLRGGSVERVAVQLEAEPTPTVGVPFAVVMRENEDPTRGARGLRIGAVTSAALAVLGAGAGVAFLVLRNDTVEQWNSLPPPGVYSPLAVGCRAGDERADCVRLRSDIDTNQALAVAGFVAGGAFAATSVVLHLLSRRVAPPAARATTCTVGLGSVHCGWVF